MYMRKENRTVILVGVGILLLAALIVVLAVLVPRIRYKSEMNARIERMLRPEPVYITLSDPLFDTGDLLGRDGKEIAIEGQAREELVTRLRGLYGSGVSYAGRERAVAGAWDLRLLVRAADGETAQIWVSETRIYYVVDSMAVYFTAKDGAAHAALYTSLRTMINT